MVESQIANLTPDLSFGHNLCFKNRNGSCESILDIYIPRTFQLYEELFDLMSFDSCNYFVKIWESIETPTPQVGAHLGVWGSFLHTFSHSREHEMWLLTSLLARTFVSLSLGREFKARVVTLYLMWFYDYDWFRWSFSVGLGMWATSCFVQVGDTYGYGDLTIV